MTGETGDRGHGVRDLRAAAVRRQGDSGGRGGRDAARGGDHGGHPAAGHGARDEGAQGAEQDAPDRAQLSGMWLLLMSCFFDC